MNISNIQPNQGKIDVELEIVSIEEPREIEKYGKVLKLVNAIGKDETGEIKLTFWNEDVDKVKQGSKIKFANAYCSEFQGQKQLSAGKYGSMEILGESSEEIKTEEKPEQETDSEEPKITEEKITQPEESIKEEKGPQNTEETYL